MYVGTYIVRLGIRYVEWEGYGMDCEYVSSRDQSGLHIKEHEVTIHLLDMALIDEHATASQQEPISPFSPSRYLDTYTIAFIHHKSTCSLALCLHSTSIPLVSCW